MTHSAPGNSVDNFCMMKHVLLAVALAMTGVGCGGKSLFSLWTSDETGFTLDLTNSEFGANSIAFTLTGGGACLCTMTISGTEKEGSAIISGCTYSAGGSGGADPGCAGLDGTFGYAIEGGTLTVCESAGCSTYR